MHNSNVGKKMFPQFIFLLKKTTEHQMPPPHMAVARADVAGQQVRVSDAARAPGTKKRRQPFKTKVKKINSFF